MTTPTTETDGVRAAWHAIADDFDRHTTPHTLAFGTALVARLPIGPGVRVLDVGAGSGALSIPAARAGADVVAVDVAPGMIDRLADRARDEGLTNLDSRVGDGNALEVDDASVDVAMSMNGVSLFPDLQLGLRELVRVTRPGGEVVLVTFGPLSKVEFIAFFLGALRSVAPGVVPPPDQPLPPFRLAEPGALHGALVAAGLRDVTVETATWETSFGSAEELHATLLSSNPIAGRLSSGLSDEQSLEVRQILAGMLRERSQDGGPAVLRSEMQIGRGTV